MKKIDKLKNSKLSRGFFALKSAVRVIPQVLPFASQNPEDILKSLIGGNVDKFIDEVGAFKGSMLKAAQLLSSYGEYYLPKELNDVLKTVQSQSHYLDWEHVEALISQDLKKQIDIEKSPIAAASIGQVHRGVLKSNGRHVVLKIQYPGVKRAIDLDIKILKGFISLAKVIPKKIDLSSIYGEIKRVLTLEMDYPAEVAKQLRYKNQLQGETGFYVPEVFSDLSQDEVIVSEYIEGVTVSDLDKDALDEQERNFLGERLFYLYFFEIFKTNLVQTDCHAGNFLVREGESGLELVLIDFGACLEFSHETMESYRYLIKALYLDDEKGFIKKIHELVSQDGGSYELNDQELWDYCRLAASPLKSTSFSWGETTLPDELYEKAKAMLDSAHIEKPPHQFIFLDRKILGIFAILRSLNATVNMKKIAETFIN